MNYVSKENAEGLKEIGFAEPCHALYHPSNHTAHCSGCGGDSNKLVKTLVAYESNFNQGPNYSAPDFLTALKWISENSEIGYIIWDYKIELYGDDIGPSLKEFEDCNAAIAHAISIIKSRKK